jgi:uncharacterized protein (TIRG00374 family)
MVREVVSIRRTLVLKAYLASQADTLLPGGGAARAGTLAQVGIPASESAAPIAISSLTDQVVFVVCSILAALWFESARRPAAMIIAVLFCISVVLGTEASRNWMLRGIAGLMGRLRLLKPWQEFLESLKCVATPRTILYGIGNAALAAALMIIALDLCARGVRAEIPYETLLLAYTLPAMLGRISAMPGGVGVTETGMIAILDSTPDVTVSQAAAAVMLFRLGTVGFAALLGGFAYLFAWRGRDETKDIAA